MYRFFAGIVLTIIAWPLFATVSRYIWLAYLIDKYREDKGFRKTVINLREAMQRNPHNSFSDKSQAMTLALFHEETEEPIDD